MMPKNIYFYINLSDCKERQAGRKAGGQELPGRPQAGFQRMQMQCDRCSCQPSPAQDRQPGLLLPLGIGLESGHSVSVSSAQLLPGPRCLPIVSVLMAEAKSRRGAPRPSCNDRGLGPGLKHRLGWQQPGPAGNRAEPHLSTIGRTSSSGAWPDSETPGGGH